MPKVITADFIKLFISECKHKHAITLAASSTFFFLLCSIPFLFLTSSSLGYFFEEGANIEKILQHFAIIIPEDIMPAFKQVLAYIKSGLEKQKSSVLVHRIFLVLSSLSFFGSIWKALEIITEEKAKNTLLKTLKSLGAILVSFTLFAMLIVGPFFLNSVQILFKKGIFKEIETFQQLNLTTLQISGINIFSTLMLFVFFFLFFKYVLAKRAKFISLLLSSLIFTGLILLTKYLFLSYIVIARDNLIGNFGSFYSVMLVMLWIFLSILSFYVSLIFAITHSNVIRDNPNIYMDLDV
ncbi:MAG: hypothetical protein CME62_11620 [Halobacteriovoraceae bacterium]|nr:hypothetical protein [Halobacteriovoraceae bacterium]|tara:strand:- start:1387 stop:2274 length:888 start_codon:yes stop_codon:yes gene_type:complete